MFELVEFISRNRSFIVFVLLQVICFRLIVSSNSYMGAVYFNTANLYVSKSVGFSNGVREYLNLRDVNRNLAEENVRLNQEIAFLKQYHPKGAPANYLPDSTFADRFEFVVGKVIDLQMHMSDNYITIDKGSADGIEPGMGVISASGVVGKVQVCSEHASIITSILHSRFMVSTQLPSIEEIGTTSWDGRSTNTVKLADISRYKPVNIGDTALTSGYNSVFPPGIMVGTIKEVNTPSNQTSYDIDLELSTDFNAISYVYVVKNKELTGLTNLQKKLETK